MTAASRFTAFLLLAGCMSAASAMPVQWTLTDVMFSDGGIATGSFIYDAATDTYSDIAITTTDAGLAPIATYGALVVGSAADAALVPALIPDLTGQSLLQLVFQFPLTDAGGIVLAYNPFFPATSSFDGSCLNAACGSVAYGRLVVDGGVIGAPAVVPLPAAAALLASSLGFLGVLRRRLAGRAPASA